MASSSYYSNGLTAIPPVILIIIFFLALFSSASVLAIGSSSDLLRGCDDDEGMDMKQAKRVLGSRPPKCINKCFNCRPCMAALVAAPHRLSSSSLFSLSSTNADETYYLLAWKCQCGDKYFQP